MNLKLLTCLACSVTLLLGACSSNNSTGTSSGTGTGGGGSNGETDGGSGDGLTRVSNLRAEALDAVDKARSAADTAATSRREEDRAEAVRLIALARNALNDLVAAADAAVMAAEDGSAAEFGAARRAKASAENFRSQQRDLLDNAMASFAWFSRTLARQQIARAEVVVPLDGVNDVGIERIPRTTRTSDSDDTQIFNPDAITSTTFKDVMYSAGDMVFSNNDDVFRTDGYVIARTSKAPLIDNTIRTGLKLTNSGLVIRTGGRDTNAVDANSLFRGDYTDMRRDITTYASDSNGDKLVGDGSENFNHPTTGTNDPDDGILGQNGWDLRITLDDPRMLPFSVSPNQAPDRYSSWTGNSAFYWRGLADADDEQKSGGEYYKANAFKNQPAGQENLGIYEVWLSNHVGISDKKIEPFVSGATVTCPDGTIGTTCPSDDVNQYLKYAAYGLFVYTENSDTFFENPAGSDVDHNGRIGRVETINFGYQAFADEEGKRTADINEAIPRGIFTGYAFGYEVLGNRPGSIGGKLLRGDVSLTVNIPKGPGQATLEGTMSSFQQWNSQLNSWTAYINNFGVTLKSANIGSNGMFTGTAETSTYIDSINGETPPDKNAGVYKGGFYGPRADADDLEIAGSWIIGRTDNGGVATRRNIYGSFGAKQKNP